MSKPRGPDPRRLDVRAFAAAAGSAQGQVAQHDLARLRAGLMATPGDSAPPPVHWQAAAELRPITGAAPGVWLRLDAQASVTLQCQRCLQPMPEPLTLGRWFRFAADEDEAARLDEESEDDVLVASRGFDLLELLEDELILALPLVPRHLACPHPLPMAAGSGEFDDEAPNPFAALAALRRPPPAG